MFIMVHSIESIMVLCTTEIIFFILFFIFFILFIYLYFISSLFTHLLSLSPFLPIRSDCVDILTQCGDRKRFGDGQSPERICDLLSPSDDPERCIPLERYLSRYHKDRAHTACTVAIMYYMGYGVHTPNRLETCVDTKQES